LLIGFLRDSGLPDSVDAIFIVKFIENTVAPNYYKVMLVGLNFKSADVRLRNYDFWVAKQSFSFSLNVTECSTH
jgi:hypothetical protein